MVDQIGRTNRADRVADTRGVTIAVDAMGGDHAPEEIVLGVAALSLEAPNVQTILSRSCNDCHSSKTTWPWYSQMAPISWLLADHVKDGRGELNFSEWATYSAKRKRRKLTEICEQVNKKEMPVSSYLWMHHDAALSPTDRNAICDWANAEKANIR